MIICYDVIDVTESEVILQSSNGFCHVNFDDCAKNYSWENRSQGSKCVAVRDITTLSFTFYTQPKTKLVFKKHFLKSLIGGKSAVGKFLDLETEIIKAGYVSFDLS